MEDLIQQLRRAALLGTEMPPPDVLADEIETELDDLSGVECEECVAAEDLANEPRAAMGRLYSVASKPDSDYAAVLDALHGIMKATCGETYDIRDAADLFAFIGQTYTAHIDSIKGGK